MYLNKYQCCGNLVRDPELIQDGATRAKFVVALNNPRKKHPTYVSCVIWGDRAFHFFDNVRKGMSVILTGELETSTFTDERGSYHRATTLVVDTFSVFPSQHKDPTDLPVPRPKLPE